MAIIEGTNVALDDLDVKIDPDTDKTWEELFAETDDPNDVLFHMAYVQEGRGQGNKSVGAVQSGMWGLTGDVADKAGGKSWADEAVEQEGSGESDIYIQRNQDGSVKEDSGGNTIVIKGKDYGKPMTLDDIARSTEGSTFLYGTNIPTTGLSIPQITKLNRDLKAEMDKGDKNAAMGVLFHAVHTLSKAAGINQDTDPGGYQEFMSRVYDGQFRFNSPIDGATTYAEVRLADPTTGTSDRYTQRDLDGNPTVELVGKDYEGPTNPNIPTKIVTGSGLIDYGGTSGTGTGVGGLISTTPYTQPAPQDWSAIRPGVFGQPSSELAFAANLPAQQAIFGPQGRAMQPWATGQQVPAGLVNYQIPGGAPANVTYSGGDPSLFDFNKDDTTTTNGDTTTTTQLQDWQKAGWDYSSGSPVYKPTGWDSALEWYKGLYGADPEFVNPLVQSGSGDTLTNISDQIPDYGSGDLEYEF